MKTIDKSAPVLVTGASGYLAGWVIKYLLEEGCTVHATVRDPNKKSSTEHLRKIEANTSGKLVFFKADLLNDGDFDAAMENCELVIHTASPFILNAKDPLNELLNPALKGTENVLNSVNKASSVKRVVLTSSVVSIFGDNIDFAKSGKAALDESDWNETSSLEHMPYPYSKVRAEKRAWEISKSQDRWDLVTINPAGIWGPSLTKSSKSATIDLLLQLADGRSKGGVPKLDLPFVDVRNVAEAHVKAAFNPKASGRYVLLNEVITMKEMADTLKSEYGTAYPFPTKTLPKWLVWLFAKSAGATREFVSKNVGHPLKFNNRKSIAELGIAYVDKRETLIDQFEQLKADGLI